jgi:hypothetical protein
LYFLQWKGEMNSKPLACEGGRVWQQQQQLLRVVLERLVRAGKLSKLAVLAFEIGMNEHELHSKISINPRTPLTRAETVQIEHFIKERAKNEYERYLQTWHSDDAIKA